jgi:hypothetical protein
MASSIDHASKKQIQKQPGSETHLIFESKPIMLIADSHEKKQKPRIAFPEVSRKTTARRNI